MCVYAEETMRDLEMVIGSWFKNGDEILKFSCIARELNMLLPQRK